MGPAEKWATNSNLDRDLCILWFWRIDLLDWIKSYCNGRSNLLMRISLEMLFIVGLEDEGIIILVVIRVISGMPSL